MCSYIQILCIDFGPSFSVCVTLFPVLTVASKVCSGLGIPLYSNCDLVLFVIS